MKSQLIIVCLLITSMGCFSQNVLDQLFGHSNFLHQFEIKTIEIKTETYHNIEYYDQNFKLTHVEIKNPDGSGFVDGAWHSQDVYKIWYNADSKKIKKENVPDTSFYQCACCHLFTAKYNEKDQLFEFIITGHGSLDTCSGSSRSWKYFYKKDGQIKKAEYGYGYSFSISKPETTYNYIYDKQNRLTAMRWIYNNYGTKEEGVTFNYELQVETNDKGLPEMVTKFYKNQKLSETSLKYTYYK